MKLSIRHSCADFDSFRAAKVKSLFNCEDGYQFALDAELPIEGDEWRIGLIVGPSGTGKSSLGARLFGLEAVHKPGQGWPDDAPIIDAIAPQAPFEAVTAALTAVGLGSVPAWLRPWRVLSTGERFRAELARIVCAAPERVVIDEFTSVVDRQIARIGALAFAKAWRRGAGGQAVLLSCHRDVSPWLQPDWVFDTAGGQFSGRYLRRRPTISVDIVQTSRAAWGYFAPHHYLNLPPMIAVTHYVGLIDGEPVAHVAVSTRPGMVEGRACRLVVLPEWQGAGVGLRFLEAVCGLWWRGDNRYAKPLPMLFHTSHPGLCAALRRAPRWRQVSAVLHGAHKGHSQRALRRSGQRGAAVAATGPSTGYGGHFRAVQGFRYREDWDRCVSS